MLPQRELSFLFGKKYVIIPTNLDNSGQTIVLSFKTQSEVNVRGLYHKTSF
jgi:hypothetical protein